MFVFKQNSFSHYLVNSFQNTFRLFVFLQLYIGCDCD